MNEELEATKEGQESIVFSYSEESASNKESAFIY